MYVDTIHIDKEYCEIGFNKCVVATSYKNVTATVK